MTSSGALLEIDGLHVEFPLQSNTVQAVRGISLSIAAGEKVGLVGESGCGKSVTAKSILRLIDSPGRIAGGTIRFSGRDLLALSNAEMRALRGNDISMIFQDPMTSLNPVITIGHQIEDVLRAHTDLGGRARRSRVVELLSAVGIPKPEDRLDAYPHQFSGGMRQRVMIAMALANDPVLLIADEPTTALDVTVQAQVLDLLNDLNERLGMAVLFISHDLRVVSDLCDRMYVVYAGRVVEHGRTHEVFSDPLHPYTRALFQAIPQPRRGTRVPLKAISGAPPLLDRPINGCSFAPRCPSRFERCDEDPGLVNVGTRQRACWLAVDGAGDD